MNQTGLREVARVLGSYCISSQLLRHPTPMLRCACVTTFSTRLVLDMGIVRETPQDLDYGLEGTLKD
jgi:hypothetical protein